MQSRFTAAAGLAALFALVRTVWFVVALSVWLPKTTTAYSVFFQSLSPVELLLIAAALCGIDQQTGTRLAESGAIQGIGQMGRVSTISPAIAWFLRLKMVDIVLLLLAIVTDSVQYAQSEPDTNKHLVAFIVADALVWTESIGTILMIVVVGIVSNRESETPTEQMRFHGAVPPHHPLPISGRLAQRIRDNSVQRDHVAMPNRWIRPAITVNR